MKAGTSVLYMEGRRRDRLRLGLTWVELWLRWAAYVVALLLAGTQLACRPQVLQVTPCPPPPVLVDPIDPVDGLRPGASPAEVAKAYAASRLLWRQAAREAKRHLDAYRGGK
jgi:hypothetical protein